MDSQLDNQIYSRLTNTIDFRLFLEERMQLQSRFTRISELVLPVVALLFPKPILAAEWDKTCFSSISGAQDVATIQCLVPMFKNIIISVVQLAGVALFLMFIIGGYQFLMSGGNPKQLEQAKGTITYAIIGVVVIVSAYLILKLITQFTGVDVTGFNIPTN